MNKLSWFFLVVALVLLASLIYRSFKPVSIDEKRLDLMAENQEELKSAIGEVLDSLVNLEQRVESLERLSREPAERSDLPEGEEPGDEVAPREVVQTSSEENYKVLVDGTLVFEEGATVDLMGGFVLSSPSGIMRSNGERTMFYGDLVVESPSGTLLPGGALTVEPDGKWMITLKDHPELRDLDFDSFKEE